MVFVRFSLAHDRATRCNTSVHADPLWTRFRLFAVVSTAPLHTRKGRSWNCAGAVGAAALQGQIDQYGVSVHCMDRRTVSSPSAACAIKCNDAGSDLTTWSAIMRTLILGEDHKSATSHSYARNVKMRIR
jgi:hypothetical protein